MPVPFLWAYTGGALYNRFVANGAKVGAGVGAAQNFGSNMSIDMDQFRVQRKQLQDQIADPSAQTAATETKVDQHQETNARNFQNFGQARVTDAAALLEGGNAAAVIGVDSYAILTARGAARALAGGIKAAAGGIKAAAGKLFRGSGASEAAAGEIATAEGTAAADLAAPAPEGTRTKINPGDAPENIQALTRENESADILAREGFDVTQNPAVPGPKNPDYLINGSIYDNFAPTTSSARNIWSVVKGKVESGQTSRIVLNLNDSGVSLEALMKQFSDWAIEGLEDVIVIKDGKVFHLGG